MKDSKYWPRHRGKRFFIFVPVAIAFFALLGWVVMWLWNYLFPSLFNWKPLNFWQAMALLVLCRILFGSFGGRKGGGPNRMMGGINQKWQQMDGGQKAKFREHWDARCRKYKGTEGGNSLQAEDEK